MPTVKFRYSAPSNISFKGQIDSRVEEEDWEEMSNAEREQVESDLLHKLIDLIQVD